MAAFTTLAALAGAGATLGSAYMAKSSADKAAEQAAAASAQAGKIQSKHIQKGINALTDQYGQSRDDITSGLENAQNYLQPYVESGTQSTALLNDILGLNGQEAQASALGKYQSSPSANILKDVIDNTIRTTKGEMASQGLLNSGAMAESLGRRLSDVNLTNYFNWENLAKGMSSQGLNAANAASGNEMTAGSNMASLGQNLGSNLLRAYTDMGTAKAGGLVGGANARLAGSQAGNQAMQYGLGQLAKTDFSNMFKTGGDVGTGSWLPTVTMGA